MRPTRRAQVLTSWIAVLATVLAALAPSAAHALAATRGAAWLEVCTAYGARWQRVPQGQTPSTPGPVDSLLAAHCPYCSLASDAPLLPPGTAPRMMPLASPPPLRHQGVAGPAWPVAWARAQPRAPPRLG
jgi:hypothetical protein